MSNPGQQGPQGTQNSGPQLLKPDDIFKLQCLNDDQKQKYKPALTNLWQMMTSKTPDSGEYQAARQKLIDWSQKLLTQERAHRQKMAAANRPQSQAGQQPNQQAQAAGQQRPPVQNAPSQPANPQGQPQPQINPQIIKHVQEFQYHLPPGGPQQGTPEGDAKLKELRNNYAVALSKQEKATLRVKQINEMINTAKSNGQDPPKDLLAQKVQLEQEYHGAKKFVEDFRNKQSAWKSQAAEQQRAQQTQPQQSQQQQQQQQQPQPQQSFPQVKSETQIKVEGGAAQQNNAQVNNMQAGGQQPQLGPQGQRPSLGSQQAMNTSQAPQQPGQTPINFTQPGQVAQPGQQQQQQRPQINPQQNINQQPQPQHSSPHPQSATSNNPSGPPVPLSHQAAVSAAQRSYSQSEPQRTVTPQQLPTGNYHNIGNREQMNNPKMPIPKTLNVQTPQPVAMGPARPTMGGPTNGAPGMMGQPVMNKFPTFQLEGEGDRILSKRKLDELVRQVTGGTEGPGGESLTPEVEEAMLQLADEFVDTVISSACKLSKLRESPQLDIRDIQLVLERNYNIRIPGYASDEIRTVRKLHPAPGWTQKMNAVQAAKVMGGKTDI